MSSKVLNGHTVVAYATQPEGRIPPRAFIQTTPLEVGEGEEAQSQLFEIFTTRRFRSAVEAMSAARNALAAVTSVDDDGTPEPLPQ